MTAYDLDTLAKENERLRAELAWIRRKLALPEDTPMFTGGGPTLAGTLHVVCSHAHGYETYIAAFKCDDKQGEIARLTVDCDRLVAELARWCREVIAELG